MLLDKKLKKQFPSFQGHDYLGRLRGCRKFLQFF